MSTNSGNPTEKDVDLFYLIKKIKEFFDRLGYSIYKFFQFVKKNYVILLILLGVGIGVGILLDMLRGDKYRHEIILVPNFESTTYLYDQIDGLTYTGRDFNLVELEPIVDVYGFIKDRYQNLEIAKYFSENNIEFNKFKKDSKSELMYRYHLMTVYTDELEDADKVLDDIINELNQSDYHLNRQKIETNNVLRTIEELTISITNINKILAKLGDNLEGKASDIYIENYSDVNELINVKRNMTDELNKLSIYQLEQEKVIYDSARIINIKDKKLPLKIVLPVFLLLSYFGFVVFKKFLNRYKSYNS